MNHPVQGTDLTNIETHVAYAYDLPLQDGSVDRAFLTTVLPEIPDRIRSLDERYSNRALSTLAFPLPRPALTSPRAVLSFLR